MVTFARSLGCDDVDFSPEDAGSDKEFLYEILSKVIKAGATTLNIPDTVGINMPSEFGRLIADIKANTPGIENVVISTHCQNDLGLSTANTISGAVAGARQLEVTVNCIGERAGNASMEEVVMALKCRGDHILGGLHTGINTRHIVMASKMVEEYSGLYVQPHKAIVGANAFAHESGIHQDGMLKHKGTYEIIAPEDIGLERSNEAGIVLGKLSGRHALSDRLKEVSIKLEDMAARLPMPNTGLISYGETIDQARTNNQRGDFNPVIADGDNGYGNTLNVKRTIRGFIQVGIAGILLEDQMSPKACGHTKGRKVVSGEEKWWTDLVFLDYAFNIAISILLGWPFAVVGDIFCLVQGHIVALLKQQYRRQMSSNKTTFFADVSILFSDIVFRNHHDTDGAVPFFWGSDSE
ncbi:hypothetical protein ACFE04_002514 [Oxalis oulophora]